MHIKKIIKKIYFDETPLSRKDYYISRTLSIFEGLTARVIFTLTTGAFLVGFAEYLGADDRFNGILGAIPVLAGMVQVFSPLVLERMERRKFLVSTLCFLHRTLLGLMVVVPLIVKSVSARLSFLAVLFFSSYVLVQFITPAASNWIVSLTPPNRRGKYFGLRETYILAGVTVVSLIGGRILDIFKKDDRQYTGFVILFVFVLLLAIANFYFLSSMKEPPVQIQKNPYSLKSIFTLPLKDAKFKKIIIMLFLWNASLQIGGPFFSVYMVTGLKLDYTFIMVMGLIGSVTNVLMSKRWGRLADRKSWAYTTKMSIGLLALTHFFWFFVSRGNARFLAPILHVMGGTSWAGINISIFNIQFQYSPEKGRTVYLGFGAAIGGLVGFVSTLIGSAVIGLVGDNGLQIAGFSAGGMQAVFALSGIGLAACSWYIHSAIKDMNSNG